jgi:hypothetical protein
VFIVLRVSTDQHQIYPQVVSFSTPIFAPARTISFPGNVPPHAHVPQDGRPMNKITFLQTTIPVVVPAAIAVLKHFLPRLPKPWLPLLAPLLGAILDVLATQQFGAGTALGAVLGTAGIGLREILDQLRKSLPPGADESRVRPPSNPAIRNLIFTPLLLTFLLAFVSAGCKTPDETAFRTTASLEAAVDHAMSAWADYVTWKRAGNPADNSLADQERKVKTAYTAYRLAMSAAYAARSAYVLDQKAGLPAWQARLEAARAAANELLALVDLFLQRVS